MPTALAGVLAGVCVTAGCGAPAGGAPAASVAPATSSAAPGTAGTAPVPPGVTLSQVQTGDGSIVTVAAFHGPVQYVLHNGSLDPGPGYEKFVHAGPAVSAAERPRLLAAFNGGFLLRSRAGGYAQEGHVFRSLRHGLASLVIDRSGHARIGVWGVTVPTPGMSIYSVRQNLWPLVLNGKRTPETDKWWRWGGTVGHVEYTARSAIGQNAAGDLLYAASMATTPTDLADALAGRGARIAMELDINPEWVQLDTASAPGAVLSAAIPRQARPASQYLAGWTRDFIAVLAPATGTRTTSQPSG
ncbi:MAG: phosphodiester glycosidase family protein [Streptosporangiaceae bacterium]